MGEGGRGSGGGAEKEREKVKKTTIRQSHGRMRVSYCQRMHVQKTVKSL